MTIQLYLLAWRHDDDELDPIAVYSCAVKANRALESIARTNPMYRNELCINEIPLDPPDEELLQ